MPLPIMLAHALTRRLSECRRQGILNWLRPDGKSQVTVEYDGTNPVRVDTVVVSSQHSPDISYKDLCDGIREHVILAEVPAGLMDDGTTIHINPTGRFVTGGPQGDCGVTGRKIIVDTYGGMGGHGGGAFSGKDPSKVDRSASYMARYIAKNCVAAGLAQRLKVQLAYAIGVAEPVSVAVDAEGTEAVAEETIGKLVRDHFRLTPTDIIETLQLRRPHLSQDGRLRPLRPGGGWLRLGTDRPSRSPARCRRTLTPRPQRFLPFDNHTGPPGGGTFLSPRDRFLSSFSTQPEGEERG